MAASLPLCRWRYVLDQNSMSRKQFQQEIVNCDFWKKQAMRQKYEILIEARRCHIRKRKMARVAVFLR
jgi:hypothetical protein